MERNLYLECYAGISGDMTVGALLDLGVDAEKLRKELGKLPVDGYKLVIGRRMEQGIEACDFDVQLEDHGHETAGHTHHSHTDHSHTDHSHTDHSHTHRTMREIEKILGESQLDPQVKDLAGRIFWLLAKAEGRVHGKPPEEVGFHEVGAVDSIVDIVGTAVCLKELGVEHIYVSDIYEGQGHVQCRHGRMPVPVPAVLELTRECGLPLRITDNQGEMVTPTGAAILGALAEPGKDVFDGHTLRKIGIGCGKRKFNHANILRAMLLERV